MATLTPQVLGQYRKTRDYVWDVDALEWVPMQQPVIEGGNVSISGDVTVLGPFGQTTMASSIPVTLASDQTPVVVTGAVVCL